MGFIGCSMAKNVAQGYVALSGKRMWGPYGTNGLTLQNWTDPLSPAWELFDTQITKHNNNKNLPTAIWIMICIHTPPGGTLSEVKQMIDISRGRTAEGSQIFITGQPVYPDNLGSCLRAGPGGAELTDSLARQVAENLSLNVTYPGAFKLVEDGCHANKEGQLSLGRQALEFWG